MPEGRAMKLQRVRRATDELMSVRVEAVMLEHWMWTRWTENLVHVASNDGWKVTKITVVK